MWNECDQYFALMVMAALLRASYELGRPQPPNPGQEIPVSSPSIMPAPGDSPAQPRSSDLTPQQEIWARKAVKKYGEAQKEKWRRWNQAMFEKA